MRQKFKIFQDTEKNTLTIREYADVNKRPKRMVPTMLIKEDFSFMAEESYDGASISKSIAKGVEALVTTLRTTNLFPIKPHATKIAESIIAIYGSSENNSAELLFDDQSV